MKTLVSLIICCVVALSVSAQNSSSATFFAQDGQKFWIVVDGIKQNDKADANVKVTGLSNNNYRVKIIFADNTLPSIDYNIQTRDVENKYFDATYNIKKDKKGKLVVRFNSMTEAKADNPANAQVVPLSTTENPASTTTTNNTTTTTTTAAPATIKQDVKAGDRGATTSQSVTTPDGQNVKMDMNVGENGGGISMDDGMGGKVNMNIGISGMDMGSGTTGSSTTTTTTTTRTTTTSSSSGTRSATDPRPGTPTPPNNVGPNTPTPPTPPVPPANTGCIYPATSTDINNVKTSIGKQSFSDNKMNVAKTFVKNKCVNVEQIKDIMGLFSFEGDKLEFAKLAYDRCVDKENYYMVSDAFSFSSSNDDLTDYINSK